MKKRYKLLLFFSGFILLGFVFPEPKLIPVAGATSADWNKDSFWFEPWGVSGVHKGVDIFADKGVPVIAATNLLVLYKGNIRLGGNVVFGLGPKWRLHYFAHLEKIEPGLGVYAPAGNKIGTVGDSGNAKGKPPHLHFSIMSLLPRPWRIDSSTQGFRKAFYLNPISYIEMNNGISAN